jgi:hypothetical protein
MLRANKLECLRLGQKLLNEAVKGRLLAVPANCKLGYRGVTSKNTLAFFLARRKLYNINMRFQ